MLVRQWMTVNPCQVSPTASVWEATTLMRRHGIRHLPVVANGWLVGVVSDRDVHADGGAPVRTVMSSPVVTASPGDDLAHVAEKLLQHRIDGVPVVDDDGLLVGMLTTTDCLLALLDAKAEPVGRSV